MNYVGVDLHKQSISVCVVNEARQVQRRGRLGCDEEERILDFFEGLGPFELVVEATASYEWFLQLLEPLAERVALAHPGKLRVIAESTRKTDKLDARVLAEFLALGMIPEAHRPTPRVREHRGLVRHRRFLKKETTALKAKIRRVFSNYNADQKNLFSKLGRAAQASLELSQTDRFVVDQLFVQLDFLEGQIEQTMEQTRRFAARGAAPEQRRREVLRSVPGVGELTAEITLAELGDPERFRSSKQAVAYAGLAPGLRESAGKRRDLSIEKQGSPLLRWALVEAAWRLVRYDEHWRAIFDRLAKRTGKKKAIVAVARRLLQARKRRDL